MDKIKSISSYDSAYKCLEAIDDGSMLPFLNDKIQDFCEHFDDYEPYKYFVLNDESVIVADSISGDVLCEYTTAEEFYQSLVYAYFEAEEM